MKGLIRRVALLAALVGVEAILGGRDRPIGPAFLPVIVKCGILFTVLCAAFGWLRYRAELERLAPLAEGPIRWPMLAVNLLAAAVLTTLKIRIERDVAALAVFVFGTLALIPWRFLKETVRATGNLIWYAAAASLAAAPVIDLTPWVWNSTSIPASRATLRFAEWMLHPLLPDLFVDTKRVEIGTHRFSVMVGEGCSGLEGLGLVIAFGIVWFGLFHRGIRWLRALALVAGGACLVFVLNSARIAALVLIGNAGAPDIALRGFHSQAGWIAFNAVAFGMAVLAQRAESRIVLRTATAAYLAPFLAILGAGMLAGALSDGFEWAYPLRVLAGVWALAIFWRDYRKIDWRFTWAGPVAGAVVFALWIAFDSHSQTRPPGANFYWIAMRVFGSCLTVPVAEELAFRGYLMRRFAAEDFAAVPLQGVSWTALIATSILFGAMHGSRWIEGIAAGIVYGMLARSRGRLGDAVAGHVTTNLLLAVYVLFLGQWQYW